MIRPATTILFNDEHLPPAAGRKAGSGWQVSSFSETTQPPFHYMAPAT